MRRRVALITLSLGTIAVATSYVLGQIGRHLEGWAMDGLQKERGHAVFEPNVAIDDAVSLTNGSHVRVNWK